MPKVPDDPEVGLANTARESGDSGQWVLSISRSSWACETRQCLAYIGQTESQGRQTYFSLIQSFNRLVKI